MLNMYVLYDHPSDYPNHFVARRFMIGIGLVEPTKEVMVMDSEKIADEIFVEQRGMVKFIPSVNDDPKIVCTYV